HRLAAQGVELRLAPVLVLFGLGGSAIDLGARQRLFRQHHDVILAVDLGEAFSDGEPAALAAGAIVEHTRHRDLVHLLLESHARRSDHGKSQAGHGAYLASASSFSCFSTASSM